jgi:mannose-6-phosphate isomerase-like protein (cupin superfamily)
MPILSRRIALQAFGMASITTFLPAQPMTHRKVVVTKPGENRFAYTVPELRSGAACKVTNEDSAGTCSLFELVARPQTGPPRHIHHREDEWYYVPAGEFLFEVGDVNMRYPSGEVSGHHGIFRTSGRTRVQLRAG